MISSDNVYALLTPLALFFVALEMGLCLLYKKDYISFPEAITNFGTAIGNQTVNVLVAAAVYVCYGYLWEHFRFIEYIPMKWYHYLVLLLAMDFIFYWVHRWGHEINLLWAAHSPHHSAQEMNFFVALRASVTQRLFSFMFFWPLTVIGFTPHDIYMMAALHLFISFLHHTELVPKLWWFIELIFTTPSHHRVHHGVNFKYLDRNYGEFLIVWDRWFGSFAGETDKVIYGMYGQPATWNPIQINFYYYTILWRDAVAASHWWDKIRIWFMPLGWRPRNLPPRASYQEITAYNQQKICTVAFPGSKTYLVLSAIFGVVLMLAIISPGSSWVTWQKATGSLLLWHMIVNWGGILESKSWLFFSELLRILITSVAIVWFSNLTSSAPLLILCVGYHLYCLVQTVRFHRPVSEF